MFNYLSAIYMKLLFNKIYFPAIVFCLTALSFGITSTVFARRPDLLTESLNKAGADPYGKTVDDVKEPGQFVGEIVTIFLGFVGTIAFVVFLYGGFLWLTARGNDDQVTRAKKYLTNGAIGTIVIILAYAGTYFITAQIYSATR